MILAHNEEEEMHYPLCYPRVRLRHKSGNREFLTVSYPFQFFGSAVGANSTLAFTGNSIEDAAENEAKRRCALAADDVEAGAGYEDRHHERKGC
jgi:hypothetical protein